MAAFGKTSYGRAPIALVVVIGLLVVGAVPAHAARSQLKELGTDPAGDAPPALDITYLRVGVRKGDFNIRIGLEGMFPPGGGYPEVPGIEWIFNVRNRTFIAEAVATTRDPRFFLFEETADGLRQLENPRGTYDWTDGYIDMLVPLELIGARSGTRILGDTRGRAGDVDAHIHLPTRTHFVDTMKTTKGFLVP